MLYIDGPPFKRGDKGFLPCEAGEVARPEVEPEGARPKAETEGAVAPNKKRGRSDSAQNPPLWLNPTGNSDTPIALYEWVRERNRGPISQVGGYILVHVFTPFEVCEQRDRKRLYTKARTGIIQEFTGISDSHKEPLNANLSIDGTDIRSGEAANQFILHLENLGYIGAKGNA